MEFDFSDFTNSYIDDLKTALDALPRAQLESFWLQVEATISSGG